MKGRYRYWISYKYNRGTTLLNGARDSYKLSSPTVLIPGKLTLIGSMPSRFRHDPITKSGTYKSHKPVGRDSLKCGPGTKGPICLPATNSKTTNPNFDTVCTAFYVHILYNGNGILYQFWSILSFGFM